MSGSPRVPRVPRTRSARTAPTAGGRAGRAERTAGTRAVVVGGGLAGMLAAAAVKDHYDHVDIVEPHAFPAAGPGPRPGVPQARHAHILMSGGADAIDALLPGTTGRLLAAGARRVPITTDMVVYSTEGWFRRWQRATQYLIACSRDLTDFVVREQVLADRRVTVRSGSRVVGLLGSRHGVTGVRVRARSGHADDPVTDLAADLVVDASGRGSGMPRWLGELGVGGLAEDRIDSGLAYASRTFRAPGGDAFRWPVVSVQASPRVPGPGQSAVLVPVEGGRWMVSLAGTRGGNPGHDPDAFTSFARGLRHPVIGDLLAHAEPLTDVSVTRSTANERRYYERLKVWPERLVVLGDAVAAYNPVYGHGMSVAAQGALALRDTLGRHGAAAAGMARGAQRAIARPVAAAWSLAVGQDIHYPTTLGRQPALADRLLQRYVTRLSRAATGSFRAATALTEVVTLQAPPASLLSPGVLASALVGPLRPRLSAPQFTAAERRALHDGRAAVLAVE
ncbi:NAD(P)/FAD-dependent oxidoreductase [Streptomyces sp. NPDC086766]|uniref:NAD(P)/FAD-dependent oxidoreductase n=1 Tax=Streptomyces sp. NPDC086766 TaxID=3365754 RepID=UPI0037F76CAE